MSDIKEKNEDKEVLINTVFTGDYTNENIGHEIINMYKTNKNENYIYISPWGTVAKENYNKIKEVIFVRAAGKNKLEIIGKASGLKYWGNEKINEKLKQKIKNDLKNLSYPEDFDKKFTQEVKDLVKNIDENILQKKIKDKSKTKINVEFKRFLNKSEDNPTNISEELINKIRNLENNNNKEIDKLKFSAYEEIYSNTYIDTMIYIESIVDIIKEAIQKKVKEEAKKEGIEKFKLNTTTKDVSGNLKQRAEKLLKEYNDVKRICKYFEAKYIHDLQLEYIEQKEVKYNYKFINEVFEGNFHSVPPIYLTFKADCVKKAKNSIIIDYSDTKIKNILKKAQVKKDNTEDNDVKLRNQSCLYYLSQKDFNKIIDTSKNGYNNDANWVDTTKLQESTDKNDEETFIDIIRKPYDELVFSNMIAYYFENDKELFKKFYKYLKSIINNDTIKEDELTINETYEISREYKVDNGRIDILIRTDDSLFIIENKIKSDINGKQYDPYTGKYSNQLINYYKHFNPDEKNGVDEDFKNIKQYYFIFTPNYNKIDKEKIKEIIQSSKNMPEKEINKSCKIIDLYNIIAYEDLYKFFKENKPKQVTSVKQKIYFEDFISSLEQHSHSCDDVVERRMENEFRQKTKK